MSLRSFEMMVLSVSLFVTGCGAAVTAVTDSAADSAAEARSDASLPDVTDDRGSVIDRDVAVASDAEADAAVDASIDAATVDARADSGADAADVTASDACVADGGNPALRFGEVYRRTINDGSGTGCTASSRCHGRPGEQFDLSNESAAYASLVGAMGSCGVRVTPCDLTASYISRLMHNPDTCRGMRHTGSSQTMTPAQIAVLDAWILGGAQR